MRAVVLRKGQLEVRETADPVPEDGELLVRTISTAIDASDVLYMDHPNPDDESGYFVWDAGPCCHHDDHERREHRCRRGHASRGSVAQNRFNAAQRVW